MTPLYSFPPIQTRAGVPTYLRGFIFSGIVQLFDKDIAVGGARPRAVFAGVGDEGGERSEPRMRVAASAGRRRFGKCERTRRYRKPPCAVSAAAS